MYYWDKIKLAYRNKHKDLSTDELRKRLHSARLFTNMSPDRSRNHFPVTTASEAQAECEAIHGLLTERA